MLSIAEIKSVLDKSLAQRVKGYFLLFLLTNHTHTHTDRYKHTYKVVILSEALQSAAAVGRPEKY